MDCDDSITQWLDQRLDAVRGCYDFESRVFYRRWKAVEELLGLDCLTKRQVKAIDRASSSATWAVQELVDVRKVVEDYFELVWPMPEELLKELACYRNVINAESRDIRDKQDVLRTARTSFARTLNGYVRVTNE